MKKKLILLSCVTIIATSCTTYNRKNPYPGMMMLDFENTRAYVTQKTNSDTLIINIESGGWNSVLGIRNENEWEFTCQGAQFLKVFSDNYTVLIPEKFKRWPGDYYFDDMEDRAVYTSENLLDCYLESINGYLSAYPVSYIVLIGSVEGACLLPLIYNRMIDKEKVIAMVSISFGGFSLYESFSILKNSSLAPADWKVMYLNVISQHNPENEEETDSFDEDFFGLTHRWYKHFINIRPFDYYKDINIPVLFIHGEADYYTPIESTRYIQKNLPDKPFEYRYYKWGFQPDKYVDSITFRNEVARWVKKIVRRKQ
jgi:hypothetical protein